MGGFLGVLMALGGLVLLIGSANIAAMLMARAVVRRRELAIRLAIGAGRRRVLRQLLLESLLLFVVGGTVGVAFAFVGARALASLPLNLQAPVALDFTPDVAVLAVGLGLSLFTGVLFGFSPALAAVQEGEDHFVDFILEGVSFLTGG